MRPSTRANRATVDRTEPRAPYESPSREDLPGAAGSDGRGASAGNSGPSDDDVSGTCVVRVDTMVPAAAEAPKEQVHHSPMRQSAFFAHVRRGLAVGVSGRASPTSRGLTPRVEADSVAQRLTFGSTEAMKPGPRQPGLSVSKTAVGASPFIPEHLVPEGRRKEDTASVLRRMNQMYHDWQAELDTNADCEMVDIPAWNQSCFKYVFHDAFEETLDWGEIQALAALVVSMGINVTVVVLNVFVNTPQFHWASTQIAAQLVFIVEFALVMIMFAFLVIAIIQAILTNRANTGFAVDCVQIARFVGEFSALQVVRLVSPIVVVDGVLPFIIEARTTKDYIKAFAVIFAWCAGCFLAALTVVIKVSQVMFVNEGDLLISWTATQFMVILGLVLNLTKIDRSYDSVTESLLECVHKHYIGPGELVEHEDDISRTIYAALLRCLDIDRSASFTFFSSVFNYHFGDNNDEGVVAAELTWQERAAKVLNFMSFIAKLDNRLLQRYLEMVDSPQYHYVYGRQMFSKCLAEGDVSGMEMAVWLCDPFSDEVYRLYKKYPDAFKVMFNCTDK